MTLFISRSKKDIVLRQSDFWTIQKCVRKMFLNNVADIRFPESSFISAANQGTLLHAGLTGHYGGLDWADELNKQAKLYKEEGKDPDAVNDALDMSHSVLAAYLRWAQRESIEEGLGAVAMVEQRLEMVVYEDENYRVLINGQADVIWERALWDFKTVGRIEAQSPMLAADLQLQTYLTLIWANTDLRPKMASHIKILRKAQSDRSKATYFAKHDVFFTEAQLKTHWTHMQSVAKKIVELYDSTRESLETGNYPHLEAPPNPSKDCSFMCPFVGVCPSIDRNASEFKSLITPMPTGGIFD